MKINADHKKHRGMMLIEIATAAAVVGIIAAILVPAILRSNTRARRILCIANQRSIYGAASRYEFDRGSSLERVDPDKRLDVLISLNYIETSCARCPSSRGASGSDYVFVYENGLLKDINCAIYPEEHDWL